MPGKLVLVRHGQSKWNLENRFTGWVDIDLTPEGEKEAHEGGQALKGYTFDVAYTSALKRAQRTLDIILEEIGQTDMPVEKDEALNERHYGDLQGLNKAETAEKHGEEQVHLWRRSYDVPPPNGESLKDTAARTLPYFVDYIEKDVQEGKNILVVAHGNSLRSIVMYLEKLSPEEIVKVNIPTGKPKHYEFDDEMKLTKAEYLIE